MKTRIEIKLRVNETVVTRISESTVLSITQIHTGFGEGDMDYRISFHDRLISDGFQFRQARRSLQATVNRILGKIAEHPVNIIPAESL